MVELLDTVRVSFCEYAAASSGIATPSSVTVRVFADVATVCAAPFVVLLDQDVPGQAQ